MMYPKVITVTFLFNHFAAFRFVVKMFSCDQMYQMFQCRSKILFLRNTEAQVQRQPSFLMLVHFFRADTVVEQIIPGRSKAGV